MAFPQRLLDRGIGLKTNKQNRVSYIGIKVWANTKNCNNRRLARVGMITRIELGYLPSLFTGKEIIVGDLHRGWNISREQQVPALVKCLGNLFLRTLRFPQSTCGKGSSDHGGWMSCTGYLGYETETSQPWPPRALAEYHTQFV